VVYSSPGRITAEVRHFASPIGIAEDPVTGSAAGALGAALAYAGHGESGLLHLEVRQGHSMGRPGEVRVIVTITDDVPVALEVGGTVVPIMSGVIGSTVAAG
jgi:trans-2,3-dihydro-3-hydroxyanthranilate isomerase